MKKNNASILYSKPALFMRYSAVSITPIPNEQVTCLFDIRIAYAISLSSQWQPIFVINVHEY